MCFGDLCFGAFGDSLDCFSATVFSFLFVVVDNLFVSLVVLDVTLNDHSRDFVDPRLLNFHLCLAEMNVEVFAHTI